MELTKKQFAKIEHLMPVARKPATISNYQFLCALPYIIENGCKWRVMPKEYGNWHSVYMKFSRWSKNGTIQKILVKTGGSHGIMTGNFINAAKRWNAIFKVKIFPESYCPL